MAHSNPGTEFNPKAFEAVKIDLAALNRRAATLKTKRCVKKDFQAAWLLRSVSVIDLTTLSGKNKNPMKNNLKIK